MLLGLMARGIRETGPAHELQLPDVLEAGLDLMLVGINPGIRSAELGHHFAGRNNRFWDLLFESGLVPRRLTHEEDQRLPDWGIGLTNIVSRATRSSSELVAADFEAGGEALVEKLTRLRPRGIGLVGVTVYRALWPKLSSERPPRRVECGRQSEMLGGSLLFVLPNPSGRNAHYSYPEMLRYWREVTRWIRNDA